VTMFLRQGLNDGRLAHQNTGSQRLHIYDFDRIWVPDTFVRQDLYSFVHDQTVPNKLMLLQSSGDVWYVMK